MAKQKKQNVEIVQRYAAVLGAPLSDRDAVRIGNRLEQLYKKAEHLTPEVVLEDARRPRSPLHKYFEWDDSSAAESWRLNQARALVRSVRVVFESDDKEVSHDMRAFISVVGEDKKRVYMPSVEAMADDEIFEQVLQQLTRDINGLKKRYAKYREFSTFFRSLHRELQKLAS